MLDNDNIRGTVWGRNKPKHKRRVKIFTPTQLTSDIYDRFLANICKRRLKFMKEKVSQYHGKNFPVCYKQKYQFQEEWEKKIDVEDKNSDKLIIQKNLPDVILSFLTIVVYTLTIWLTNIDYFILSNITIKFYNQVYSLAISIVFFNVIYKFYREQGQKFIEINLKKMLKKQYKNILLFIYFIIKLSVVNQDQNPLWFLYQSCMLIIIYSEASSRYHSIRITNFCLQYEYQTKVLDMITTIFIIAHIIAIILYSSTKLSPDNNWSTNLQIDRANEFIVYLYSFYFCTTTIMTIGYGDITPKNSPEVAIVIFVQIFGVVMLAYIINQIGYCITSLRKDQQTIQKDLSILQKLKKHYKMNLGLVNKVRSQILNNKPKTSQLSPEQEKGILMKLNQQIRADILKQNLVSIVKSSIFFLCRWTYHFQSSVSSKLVHVMFNPNDLLPQPQGKQRIYIIKSGKIQIFAGRVSGKKSMNKVLKTITNTIDSEVSDNCYGYTSAISIRPVKLYAISKDFTSCYYIEKDKFLQSTLQRINDREYYHQLKSQIDQANAASSIEISSLNSCRHHYNPSKTVVIRKYCKFSSEKQQRSQLLRNDRAFFRSSKPIFDDQIKRRIKQTFIGTVASFDTICFGQVSDEVINMKTQILKGKSTGETTQISFDNSCNSLFQHYFESSKEYINYFCISNQQQVLKRYEKNNFSAYNPSSMKKSKIILFSQSGYLQIKQIHKDDE